MKKRLLSWLLCAAMVIGLVPTMAVSALADELAEAYTLSDDYISVSVSKKNGGFTVLLRAIHKIFRGKKGGQLGVGILVALLDIATANNTVAIVMANPIAKQMSEDYGITPRKTASLLDTFSCISQGILPYGAQMLVAISAVHELGYELSAFEIMANLFYPGMLLVSSLIFIFVLPDRKNVESNA